MLLDGQSASGVDHGSVSRPGSTLLAVMLKASGTITRVSLRDAVAAYEKDLISDALKTTRGNRAKAARLLNTTERIINYQVRKYAIDYRRFKN